MRRALTAGLLAIALAMPAIAAERKWQTGTWGDISTKRQIVDFGPGSSPFGQPGTSTPTMRAMAEIRRFVIETDEMRLELEDTVSIRRRSLEASVGGMVTFALEKKSVYVRDSEGVEHKLRLVKKIDRTK